MILRIFHPTRGPIGAVELKDGVVVKTSTGGSSVDRMHQMKGWIEASVREYAKMNNWIIEEQRENLRE